MSSIVLSQLLEKLNETGDLPLILRQWEQASGRFQDRPEAEFWRAVNHHFNDIMIENLEALSAEEGPLRIRDKIAMAVFIRLKAMEPFHSAMRQLARQSLKPQFALTSGAILWETADRIWYWAGDTATDFNHYTKRGLLFAVLSATHLYWLRQETLQDDKLRAFIDQAIDRVMGIAKVKAKVAKALSNLPFRRFFSSS